MLKFPFALEQRIDESQEMILNELKSGPYELILDPDVNVFWKNTESIIIMGSCEVAYFSQGCEESSYKATHNRAEREDAWARAILSKVHFHPAIGDAIDDDGSGYISIEEGNDFMRRKPERWPVPQWVAYWAYGCRQSAVQRQAEFVTLYLSGTERIAAFVNSINMREIDPPAQMKMDRLRDELRSRNENEIKTHFKSVNHRIDHSVLAAVTGSERVEETYCALASLLVSRYLWQMNKPDVTSEAVEEAISSMVVLIDAMHDRIAELKSIWRCQRIDVNTQIGTMPMIYSRITTE
ncbi:hypothetical protein B0F90DRAFT_1817704 [Multifurca ochricompacta]|uniref:Uncharacterized protein n=1 Tax=Multifurca ochricompacta TaxID=376703 RepID=A0AAD4M2V0_9AGAM|nr:hypothetical protein B0F90DRAFT_1817704 [Multifurca ochricompacta]